MHNAIRLLKKDHQNVKTLFRKFEKAGSRAFKTKQELAEQICDELEAHTELEEKYFYPFAKEQLNRGEDKLVVEALQEHNVVKRLIKEIRRRYPEHEEFEAKMAVLIENVRHHIREEEETLFPALMKKLAHKEDLDLLGEEMHERKAEMHA